MYQKALNAHTPIASNQKIALFSQYIWIYSFGSNRDSTASAMLAINAWMMMLVTSLVWLVRRHHVSALAAKAAAPIGMTFTLIALVTGAIWGQPMWGTWWAWDPRLTAFLILAGYAQATATIAIAAILIAGGGLIAAKDMVWRKS